MGTGSTDPLIFKLGSIWMCLIHYTSGLLTPGKSLLLSNEQEEAGLQSRSGRHRRYPVLQRLLIFIAVSPRAISI